MVYLITMTNRPHGEHRYFPPMIFFILFNIAAFLIAPSVIAAEGDLMDRNKFYENIRNGLQNGPNTTGYDHENFFLGERRFVPLNSLVPGQPEISIDNVFNKIRSAIKSKFVVYNSDSDSWTLNEANGLALLPASKSLKVAITRGGLVLVDGHHHYFMSILTRSKLVPVEIVADYSYLDDKGAWLQMEKDRLVFNRTMDGKKISHFPSTLKMIDNPNRYMASLLALKVEATMESGSLEVTAIKKRKNAVWIKVNNGVPFVEFYIARLLTDAGIVYNPK